MSKTYQTKRARASGPKQFAVPAEVTIALEEIAGSAKEGLLARTRRQGGSDLDTHNPPALTAKLTATPAD